VPTAFLRVKGKPKEGAKEMKKRRNLDEIRWWVFHVTGLVLEIMLAYHFIETQLSVLK